MILSFLNLLASWNSWGIVWQTFARAYWEHFVEHYPFAIYLCSGWLLKLQCLGQIQGSKILYGCFFISEVGSFMCPTKWSCEQQSAHLSHSSELAGGCCEGLLSFSELCFLCFFLSLKFLLNICWKCSLFSSNFESRVHSFTSVPSLARGRMSRFWRHDFIWQGWRTSLRGCLLRVWKESQCRKCILDLHVILLSVIRAILYSG